MKNNSLKKRIKICFLILSGCLLTAGLIFILWLKVLRPHKSPDHEKVLRTPPIERDHKLMRGSLSSDSPFQALIAYMFDSSITDEFFTKLFGFDVYTFPGPVRSIRMYEDSLDSLLSDISYDDFPEYALLGLDPYAIYLQSCSSREMYLGRLDRIRELASDHPYCHFLVILPDDNADKWNSFDAGRRSDARLSYILMVRHFADTPNITVYYHSLAEWVLYSDCIREYGKMQIKPDSYNHLVTLDSSSPDLTYLLTADTVNSVMDSVIEMSSSYGDVRASYPDLSGKKVFFLGDSVFGNFRNETSVTSFFADMTGAKVYNLGQGGRSAYEASDASTELGCAVSHLFGGTDDETFDKVFSDFDSYFAFRLAARDLAGTDGSGSLFIVEYGLNDYFSGIGGEDYKKALIHIVTEIKGHYPAADILLVAPGYIGMYDNGETALGENGMPLQGYRDIMYECARENGCGFVSLADDMGFTQEGIGGFLLPDVVHYNENGRYLLARGLAEFLSK